MTDTVVVWDTVTEESLWLFKVRVKLDSINAHNTLQMSEKATRNQQTAIVDCL